MKSFLPPLFCFLFVMKINAQNLVPNPSFEDTVSCPTYADDIDHAVGWSSFSASPDYFNPCTNSSVGVPINFPGHQSAYDGNSYAGIISHTSNYFPPTYSYREFIGAQLLTPLVIGSTYYVSAFISRADTFGYDCATNKFGFRFSTHSYSGTNPVPVDNFSNIHSDSIILNKDIWTYINGSFVADSQYKYFIVGNFYDEAHTDTAVGFHPGQYVGYYYVDAICVSTDSLCYLTWTGIEQAQNNSIKEIRVFPNPTASYFQVENMKGRTSYSLIDILGRKVKEGTINVVDNRIDVENLVGGIYILQLSNSWFFKIQITNSFIK